MVGNRKAETETHSLFKHLIASILERKGHKVVLEAEIGDMIADVFDRTASLVYEVQSLHNKRYERKKTAYFRRCANVIDVIFIYPKEFNPQGMLNSKLYRKLQHKLLGSEVPI